MAVARILREQGVAQTRWAALDRDGNPIGIYTEPADGRMMLGQRLEGHIRASAPGAGGVFIEAPGHGDAFLRLRNKNTAWVQGSSALFEVIAEPREGKLARVEPVDPAKNAGSFGAEAWRAGLTGGTAAPIEDVEPGHADIESALARALSPSVTLPGGGRLGIDHTRALTAGDIDTAGRINRGTAAARALSVNRDAAACLARELLLRGIGGLCVLDCIAPLAPSSASRVREAFLDAWTDLTYRRAKVLTPSALGLMELSTDWWITPARDHLYDANGKMKGCAVALEGLRQLERQAVQSRLGRLQLALPRTAREWLNRNHPRISDRLAAKYGPRLEILVHDKPKPEVSAVP